MRIQDGEHYYDVAETAVLIRAQLKKHWPGQKFYVRSKSYAGGASIDINWIDGPTDAQVQAVINGFKSKGFDGMIDLSYYKTSWFNPYTGEAGLLRCEHEEFSIRLPIGAVEAHFASNYVSTHRHYSRAFLEAAVAERYAEVGGQLPVLVDSKMWVSDKTALPCAYMADTWPDGSWMDTSERYWYNQHIAAREG